MPRFSGLLTGLFLATGVLSLAACGGGGGASVAPRVTPIPSAAPTGDSIAVTNTNDSGAGSLRAAIQYVNGLPTYSSSTITFTTGGTITLASALPPITTRVNINGTTAPLYYTTGPVVEINANGNAGLVFAPGSNGSQLLGIAIGGANGNGVTLNDSSIVLNQDYIGLNLLGEPLPNTGDGVYVSASSSNNRIGLNASGAAGAVANVISANAGNGISFHGSSGNVVVTNYIGTNPEGTAAMPNQANGIWITAASNNNTIGGTLFTDSVTGQTNNPTGSKGTVTPVFVIPPLGNLVSGNAQNGILIDTGSQGNVLNGNFVGTVAGGDAALGNAADGVRINGANGNSLIGCQFVNNPFVYYNVIDSNGQNGLHITNSNNTTVQANFFGAGANNTTLLGNGNDGMLVDGSSANTTVGGVIPLGNVSVGNKQNGIEVTGTASAFTTFNTFGGLLAFKGAAPNGNDGLLITATGGNQTVRTNVFSGNVNNGVEIGGNASGVTVEPDIIGLTTNGMALLPNGNDGVLIDGTAHANIIGGYDVSVIPQNTISGNGAYGVAIIAQANNNTVFDSFIGTDVLATVALANGKGGVYIGGTANHNLVGGTSTNPAAPTYNIISGNTGNGVTIDTGTSYTSVIGNWFGLNRLGLPTLPNSGLPILVSPGSSNNTISGNLPSP